LDRCDERCCSQVLEWAALDHAHGFDIEALGLHEAEQLLDCPALAVQVRDLARICERCHAMRRQQSPMHRRDVCRRIDLARLHQSERDLLRQFGLFAWAFAPWPQQADLPRSQRQHGFPCRLARLGR
jgi:hypothetical protein